MSREPLIRTFFFAGILVMVALLAMRFHVRFDLTKNGDYTLSRYTRSVLSGIDEPVSITWYRSDILQRVSPDIRHIEDMFEEYRIASAGNFVWRIVDTSSAPVSEKIRALGIVPRQLETGTEGNSSIRTIYSGVLIEYASFSMVIPFVSESRHLEYDLTRMIADLTTKEKNPAKNAIQLVYGIPDPARLAKYVEPWLSYAGFTVISVPPQGATFDEGIPLVVLGSSAFDSRTVDSIDSFLSAGGAAAFFVSGTKIDTAGDWTATAKPNDPLIALLASMGARIESDLVVDASCFRMTLPALDNSRYETVDYPFWVSAKPSPPEQDRAIAAGIDTMQFYWPSSITLTTTGRDIFHPIVSSSPSSARVRGDFDTNPFSHQIDSLIAGDIDGKSVLAVCAAKEKAGRLVIVADELFPSSMNDYTGNEGNLDFLVNCAEWLSGRDAILALKRPPFAKPRAVDIGSVRYRIAAIAGLVVIPLTLLAALVIAAAGMRRKR
jgi:ABC-type uncharacterized transport system involved in gliding motility auxiliary subunit